MDIIKKKKITLNNDLLVQKLSKNISNIIIVIILVIIGVVAGIYSGAQLFELICSYKLEIIRLKDELLEQRKLTTKINIEIIGLNLIKNLTYQVSYIKTLI
jgi:hypothetical protein